MKGTLKPMPSSALAFSKSASAGTPVVFLHGLLRNRDCFAPLFPALAARQAIYRVDQAGHGASPRLDSYRVVDHLPGLAEFLRRELDGEPAVLYGHSMGAMLAAALGAEFPELACAVVLEDPPFHTMGERIADTPLLEFFRALQPYAGRRASWKELAAVRVPVAGHTEPVALGQVRDSTQVRFMARCFAEADPRVLDTVLEGRWLDGYSPKQVFGELRCPALLLQADPAAGGMLSDEDAAMGMRLAADLSVVRLAGVGHQAHWQDAPAVIRHLFAFLESLR